MTVPYVTNYAGKKNTPLPTEEELVGAGVTTFDAEGGHAHTQSNKEQISKLMSQLEGGEKADSNPQAGQLISLGFGLSAISKKLVTKILANEYVDFADLPPAKGKSRPLPNSFEGQVVLVQAADFLQARKIIPDLATWVQCFSLYVAVVATKFPERIPELMAYQSTIAKASQKYRWPSWIVYDQNFRQEAAGNPAQSWAKVDPSVFAQCFTGQAMSAESWCAKCQSLDHTSTNCPYRQKKRPWNTAFGTSSSQLPGRSGTDTPVCIKYNKFNGDCKFGKDCRFLHVCSSCREYHPCSHPLHKKHQWRSPYSRARPSPVARVG